MVNPDFYGSGFALTSSKGQPMSTDDRTADKLPVTAEVGDEGGSYADATKGAETFNGAAGNSRIDQKGVRPDGDLAAAASQGEQVRDARQLVKHATEPPGND
jgi:hypothetical protein